MFLLRVLLVLLTIIVFLGLGNYVETHENNVYGSWFEITKKQIIATVCCLILLLGSFFCLTYIPANNVGIKWSAFGGGTSEKTLGEGVKIKSPFDEIYCIDTKVQERTMENVKVHTRDAQYVTSDVNVKFRVNPKNAYKVYKRYGTLEELTKNIVSNYSQKSIENVVTQYNVMDVLGSKKNEIYEASTKKLEGMLSAEGVELVQLTIKDTKPGKAIEKAIAQEAVAKKQVETAEQNRLKAKKDAETKIIQAEAEAKANKLKQKAITKEIIQQKMIEKWNGELPKVNGNSGSLFTVDSFLK